MKVLTTPVRLKGCLEAKAPMRGPNIELYMIEPDLIEVGEVKQPEGPDLLVYQIKWPNPVGNLREEVEQTVAYAKKACELRFRDGFKWSGFALVHGRNSSFLNLLPDKEGGCPNPTLGDCLICIGGNKFQYRYDNWGVISIEQDKSELKERYKIATLSRFKGGVIEKEMVPFIGMIQNLALTKGEELHRFFSDD